ARESEYPPGADLARRRLRRVAIASPRPLEVLGARAGAAHQTERLGLAAAHIDPGMATVLVFDQLRGTVEVRLLEPLFPEVGWLERMRIGGDDAVRALRHIELLPF